MTQVKTPVEGFTGEVAGVAFANGVGETDNPNAINYFRRHGYEVGAGDTSEAVEIPEGEPSEDWKGDQLKAYAAAHEIDLGGATKKADMVAAIAAAKQS